MKRFGTNYGGFYYPENLDGLDESSIIYCVGAGEDISHDIEIANKLNSNVYIIDPTPRALKHYEYVKNILDGKKKIIYDNKFGGGNPYEYWKLILENKIDTHKIIYNNCGLGIENGIQRFYLPSNEEYVSCSLVEGMKGIKSINVNVKKLKTLMNEYGHNKIDLLKMDIEGSECDVIEDMLNNKIYPKYLAVEFDLAFNGENIKDVEKCNKIIKKLYDNNYKLIYQNNSDFTFAHYLYFEGRPHGLGNRLEEIIVLEAYAQKYNYLVDYHWNNSLKNFYWNDCIVRANFDINFKSQLVNIIQKKHDEKSSIGFFDMTDHIDQNDFLKAGKKIKPLFDITFENNIKPIGIHIRGTDRIGEGKHNMTKEHFNNIFTRIINKINENNYKYVFICSEYDYYKNEFIKKLNKNIKVINPIVNNIDIKNDIVDLFALSLCDKIYLCSKFSSYSIIASIIGNIDLICNYDQVYENEIKKRYKAKIKYL